MVFGALSFYFCVFFLGFDFHTSGVFDILFGVFDSLICFVECTFDFHDLGIEFGDSIGQFRSGQFSSGRLLYGLLCVDFRFFKLHVCLCDLFTE